MCRIFLAGPSGVGKTTIAKTIAEKYGLEYVEMKAPECISSNPFWRQACFRDRFMEISREHRCRNCVFDNSLLTVYIYGLVHGIDYREVLEETIKSMITGEAVHVMLLATPEVVLERLKSRGDCGDPLYISTFYYFAGRVLRTYGFPSVSTLHKRPEEVAEEVVKTAGCSV